MSVNKYNEHLIVIPEDRANEEIANGFITHNDVNNNVVFVERPPKDNKKGGWGRVVKRFKTQLVRTMISLQKRYVLLLIDFDNDGYRFNNIVEQDVPNDLKARVFILGTFSEPEKLKKKIHKTFEQIGEPLAEECATDNYQ